MLDGATAATVASGELVDSIDFGYNGSGSIGDTVWIDTNEIGVQDVAGGGLESGIPGVSLTVTWFGPDGVAGTADDFTYPVQVTDADGQYLYDNLPFGKFSIVVGSADDYVSIGSGVLEVEFTAIGGSGLTVLTVDFPFVIADEGTLPTTGLAIDRLAVLAGAMLLMGGVLVLLARLRRQES